MSSHRSLVIATHKNQQFTGVPEAPEAGRTRGNPKLKTVSREHERCVHLWKMSKEVRPGQLYQLHRTQLQNKRVDVDTAGQVGMKRKASRVVIDVVEEDPDSMFQYKLAPRLTLAGPAEILVTATPIRQA